MEGGVIRCKKISIKCVTSQTPRRSESLASARPPSSSYDEKTFLGKTKYTETEK
jgi:hypothetical protein